MPRIPERFLNVVFYLYGTPEAAERGDDTGGTGFFVHVPFKSDKNHGFRYGVTNKHVARSGASVIRLKCEDGKSSIFDIGPEQWTVHPNGDDLAIIHLSPGPHHKVDSISTDMFATEEDFNSGGYGIGDATFTIGRFVAHDGKETNVPAVGFGNISIPPSKMMRSDGFEQLSFGVEMRSMKGSSGSPVFTFTEAWDMQTNMTRIGSQRLRLLGVDWGQIVHPTEVKEHIIKFEPAALRPGEREAKFVLLNTGMNGIIPAWKLQEILNLPLLVSARESYEKHYLESHMAGK